MVENEECLLRQECPLWVKSRHVQCKSGMSALPPKADMTRGIRDTKNPRAFARGLVVTYQID